MYQVVQPPYTWKVTREKCFVNNTCLKFWEKILQFQNEATVDLPSGKNVLGQKFRKGKKLVNFVNIFPHSALHVYGML